jgi:hypothetical protein
MSKAIIPPAIDAELLDVAKDVIRGARSKANLTVAKGLGFGIYALDRLNEHVESMSDRQYRVELAPNDFRSHVAAASDRPVYCARIDNRTREARYFLLSPAKDPVHWADAR